MLTLFTGAATTTTYAYDGLGDRLSVSDGATTLTTTTDDQGWPTTADSTGGAPDVVYSWNPDGSLAGIDDQVTSANDRTFVYDAWGGTSSATAGTASITYGLDAFERTTSRTQGAASTTLTYQGASETLVKSTTSTGAVTSFSSTPGGPLSAKTGTATAIESLRDLHGDTVGSFTASSGTTAMSDETWYSPFGEPTALAGGLPLLGYQGDLTDPSTGEVHMLTRQYVPSLGRFSTRDVLGGDPADPPSLNQWVYAQGNPITNWDPNGLAGCPSAQDKCPSNPIPKSGNDGSDSESGTNGCGPHESSCDDYSSNFDPNAPTFQGWVDTNETDIRNAADAFGIPPSWVAGGIVNEKWNDSKHGTTWEAVEANACSVAEPIASWIASIKVKGGSCETASYGPGQIQLRRGRLVDEAVHGVLGDQTYCSYPRFAQARTCSNGWLTNDDAIVQRLRDERTNIYYTAAYLALLKSRAPLGASSRDIYGTTYDSSVGSYNGRSVMISGFVQARDAYAYLDL